MVDFEKFIYSVSVFFNYSRSIDSSSCKKSKNKK